MIGFMVKGKTLSSKPWLVKKGELIM